MARKKKDKHGVFEECADTSFASGKNSAPPPGGKGFSYFGAALKQSRAETAAEEFISRKLAESARRRQTESARQPKEAPPKAEAGTARAAEKKTNAAETAAPARTASKAKRAGAGQSKHYEGHRQRLRARFIKNGSRDMEDYEFLELLLFRSVPRRDTKPLAKALLAHFGNFSEVFSASPRRLQEVKGCGETIAADLKIIHAATARILKTELLRRDILSSWEDLISYCRAEMAAEEREQFRVLFLDKKNGLIAEEILQTGTVDHTAVYPRNVMGRALELGASAIILVHNHPSGDPTPSRQDIDMTKMLRQAAEAMNITIHDHLIVGRNGYSRFSALGLL